jgi:hypothetical protein
MILNFLSLVFGCQIKASMVDGPYGKNGEIKYCVQIFSLKSEINKPPDIYNII